MTNNPSPRPTSDSTIARNLRAARGLLTAVVVFLVFTAMKLVHVVFIPVVISFFLAMLVRPLQHWVETRVSSKFAWLSYLLAMLVVIGGLVLFLWLIYLMVAMVIGQDNSALDKLIQGFDDLREQLANYGVHLPDPGELGPSGDNSANGDAGQNGEGGAAGSGLGGLKGSLFGFAQKTLMSLTSIITTLILVIFITLMILLEWDVWGRKMREAIAHQDSDTPHEAVDEMGHKVRSFMWVQTVVGLMAGVGYALLLFPLGVPFAFSWSVLAFLLNYVPTIGVILSMIPPIVMAMVTLSTWKTLVVIIGLIVIQQVLGNYIDPRLMGKSLRLSPVVVLVSLTFWSWMWGPVGTFLAVPMTAMLVAASAHIPTLRPVAVLLGGADELDDNDDDSGGDDSSSD